MRRLDLAARGRRLPHAFLFAGPTGVGKRMAALRLARRLLCSGAAVQADACGRCDDCAAVAAGTHIDLHTIDRMSYKYHPDPIVRGRKGTVIGVDVIRHFVTDPIARHPARGRAKLFIIDEAERMNDEAQNALLKTLEEPPGAGYLLMITSSLERMLPTVRSRCQAVNFARLPDEFIREKLCLAGVELADADRDYLVGLSDGRLGIALRYAERGLYKLRGDIAELVASAADDPSTFAKPGQDLVKSLADEQVAPSDEGESDSGAARAARELLIAMLTCTLRDVMRRGLGAAARAHAHDPAAVERLARRMSPRRCAAAIRALTAAETDFEKSANLGLVFDSIGIALGRAAG